MKTETTQRGQGLPAEHGSRTDSERLDFLEKHFEQLYRRGNPDMGGNDIVLQIRL